MGCLCCKPATPEPTADSQCIAAGENSGGTDTPHSPRSHLPRTDTANDGGRWASPVKPTQRRKKKLRRKSTNNNRKTNQHARKQTWLTRDDIDQMIDNRLRRTAARSDDSSLATAADSLSLQSISDLSNSDSKRETAAVYGPSRSSKRSISPGYENSTDLGIRDERPGNDMDSDSSACQPRESLWNLRHKAETDPQAAIELKHCLRPKAAFGRRRPSKTDALCVYHHLTHEKVKEDELTENKTQTNNALTKRGPIMPGRGEGVTNITNKDVMTVARVSKKDKVILVSAVSSQDKCTTHPVNEDETAHTQPINDNVNEDERVMNTQSGDLILENIEDVDDPNKEQERTLPIPSQTNNGAGTDTRPNERVTAARQQSKPNLGQVKVAWSEPPRKEKKVWRLLRWVTRKNKISPCLDQGPDHNDLDHRQPQHTRHEQKQRDGRQARLSFTLPNCVDTENCCFEDDNEMAQ